MAPQPFTAPASPSITQTWIEISAGAIRHNFQVFANILGKDKVAPVIKSNAYGHGIREVYDILAPLKPAWLCTNYAEEAALIRAAGFAGRLLVVGPETAQSMKLAAEHNAEVFITSADVLTAWIRLAKRPKGHIKFDTGMSRQGFLPADADQVLDRLENVRADVTGICTHFANVEDVTEQEYSLEQLDRFEKVRAKFAARGMNSLVAHAAASAACLILTQSRLDLGRVGISLYGEWPSQATRISFLQMNKNLVELKAALTWRTQISLVKPVPAGNFIGYGCTYRAPIAMKVAVLPVGYFEGVPRAIGHAQSYVLIRGQRAPVVGRICMNMMMVDVTHVADAQAGDIVTLIGKDGKETLHASDMASWAQTIHYELLSRIHPSIERRRVD